MWTFYEYVDRSEPGAITEWIAALPNAQRAAAKAALAARLLYLSAAKEGTWARPYWDMLRRTDEIYEIRFKAKNIQHRVLSCYGPERHEVVMLIGAIEKGNKFEPGNVIGTAEDRKKLIREANHVTIYDFS